jgi:predicted porin
MKKSLIAVAVAGAVGAPLSSAQAAEAYGFVSLQLEQISIGEDGGTGLIFHNGNFGGLAADESSLSLHDNARTRFGFRGSEDLGNGMTAGYRMEYDIDGSSEDAAVSNRLSWVSLSGDFGTLKVGTQWSALYNYLGWNIYRSDSHGAAGWYYLTSTFTSPFGGLPDNSSGLRISDTISYTFGAGPYGSDPFTFTVEARSNAGGTTDTANIDALTLAGQAAFGDVRVQALHFAESNDAPSGSPAEPSLTGLGARWSSGPLYLGGVYMTYDPDVNNAPEPSVIQVLAGYDFGGGVGAMAGFSTGDGDAQSGNTNDLTAFFLQADRDLSSRTKIFGEFETATLDEAAANGEDLEDSVLSVGIKHSF